MLHRALNRISQGYGLAATEPLAGHSLAGFIRYELPNAIRSVLADGAGGLKSKEVQGRAIGQIGRAHV